MVVFNYSSFMTDKKHCLYKPFRTLDFYNTIDQYTQFHMEKYTISSDGQKIHYKESGSGSTTLIFIHGWLGNTEWWAGQQNISAVNIILYNWILQGMENQMLQGRNGQK